MSQLKAASVIALFFALRCIVPLLITAAIAYLLNRLVDRWEAEAEAAASSPASIPVQGTVTTVAHRASCLAGCCATATPRSVQNAPPILSRRYPVG
jgi:hypothetical protein